MARRYPGGPFDPFEQSPFGSPQELRIPRPPRRVWIGLGFVGAGLLVLFLTAPLIGFWTEAEWFQALRLGDVYLTRVGLQAWLFVGGLLLSLAFMVANVAVATRIRSGSALRAVGIRRRTLFSGAGAAGLAVGALVSLILAGAARGSLEGLPPFL